MRRVETRVFRLRYMPAAYCVEMLIDPSREVLGSPARRSKPDVVRTLIPKGVDALSPDDLAQTLTVTGDTSGLAEMEQLLRLLDVKSRTVRIVGRIGEPVQAEATVQTNNNAPVTLPMLAEGKPLTLSVIPHVNGDATISLFVSAPKGEEIAVPGEPPRPADDRVQVMRRIRSGEPLRLEVAGRKLTITATVV